MTHEQKYGFVDNDDFQDGREVAVQFEIRDITAGGEGVQLSVSECKKVSIFPPRVILPEQGRHENTSKKQERQASMDDGPTAKMRLFQVCGLGRAFPTFGYIGKSNSKYP